MRDRYRLAFGVAVVAFLLFNAGGIVPRRKMPGVVRDGTIAGCAAWMVGLGIVFCASLAAHWRIKGGKVVHGSFIDTDWHCAVAMAIGLALGMIPAAGRWIKSRQSSAISSQ